MDKQVCYRFIYKCQRVCNDPLKKAPETIRDASWKLFCDIILRREMNAREILYIEDVLRDKIRSKYFIEYRKSCSYLLVDLTNINKLDINIVNIEEVADIEELAFRNLHFKEIEE